MNQWINHPAGFDMVNLADSRERDDSLDAVDAYFECITTCSLDDQECITVCTTKLRDKN